MALEAMESKTVGSMQDNWNDPKWLSDKRAAAFELFNQKPMPNFIYGLNINLNIDLNLDDISVKSQGKPIREIFNKNKNVKIFEFNAALKDKESMLKENFMSCVKATDKFTLFHQAFVKNGLLVYILKNAEIKQPIELVTKVNSNVLFDHLIIFAEDNSEASIVEEIKSSDDKSSYVSKIVEIFASGNAKINYGNLQMLNDETFNFTIKRANLGKDAAVNWLDCNFGSKVTLSEVSTNLNGEGAMTNNYGIFFGSRTQQFDLVANSMHNAPNTISDIFTKGALTEKAKCIYRGLVKIQNNASGSNGYQKEDTLLLSPDAAADSIPNLEIDNSDVRCTHGASIGRIDREKLFYLKSRGLNEKESTRIYVKGFFEELIQKMQIEQLRNSMHDLIDKRME